MFNFANLVFVMIVILLVIPFVVCVSRLRFVLSVPSRPVITCWERVDLIALFCVMFPCVFVTFPYGVYGQVWCLIISIPDLCLLLYFYYLTCFLESYFQNWQHDKI